MLVGQLGRQTDGWMNEWMEGWRDGGMEGWMEVHISGMLIHIPSPFVLSDSSFLVLFLLSFVVYLLWGLPVGCACHWEEGRGKGQLGCRDSVRCLQHTIFQVLQRR